MSTDLYQSVIQTQNLEFQRKCRYSRIKEKEMFGLISNKPYSAKSANSAKLAFTLFNFSFMTSMGVLKKRVSDSESGPSIFLLDYWFIDPT